MPHVHNALHHFTQIQDAYRKALGETDPGFTGIERAGETVTPTIDLWAQPDWAFLQGRILFARRVSSAAVAGRFSSVELVNPAGSGILVVTELIRSGTSSLDIAVDSGTALGVTATTQGLARDTRYPAGPVSVATVVTGDLAAGVTQPQDRITSGVLANRPYILRPGTKLFLVGLAVNTAIEVVLYWMERRVLNGEL